MTADKASITLTVDLTAAYVVGNKLEPSALPGLIQSIYASLISVGEPAPEAQAESAKASPSQIRKSITPEALISFEDGKPYKFLKRHLSGRGMSVADYKSKWGLPADYPVVATGYAARRSEIAKSLGLGRKAAVPIANVATEAPNTPIAEAVTNKSRSGTKLSAGKPNPKKMKS